MSLEFIRYRGDRTHAATRNGRVYVIRRLGPKRYLAQILRLSHQDTSGASKTCRTLALAKRWLEDEAAAIARREMRGGRRTPIVSAIERGRP